MGARQHARLGDDRTHGLHVAAVDPLAAVEDVPAHDLGFELLEHGRHLAGLVCRLAGISSTWGLSTNSLLRKPTRAAPIGPMNGAPESVSAADAATIATTSGSFSRSCESTVTITWVSQR